MTFSKLCTCERFAGDCRGASAIEFALLLPLMLTVYIGGSELAYGLSAQFKATLAARTVADLASQYISIDNPTMTGILGAASKVVAPFPATQLVIIVSEVTTDANGKGTITWSAGSLCGSPRSMATQSHASAISHASVAGGNEIRPMRSRTASKRRILGTGNEIGSLSAVT